MTLWRLELVAQAKPMTPLHLALVESLAAGLGAIPAPSERATTIARVLEDHEAVASFTASVDDVTKILAESAGERAR